jgi:cell volume regulation protein A
MRPVEPRPWSLGVRLRNQPEGVLRYQVAEGACADGRSVRELHLGEDIWISLVVRHGHALPVHAETRLRAGDEVLVLTDPEATVDARALFTDPAPP